MYTNTLIFVLATLTNLTLLVFLLFKRRKDWKNPIIISFSLAILFFVAWFVVNYFADISLQPERALWWTRLTVPFSLLALWFLLWFSFVFPLRLSNYLNQLTIHLLFVGVVVVASLTNLIFVGVTLNPGVGVSDMVLGSFYPIMMGVYLVLITHTISNFVVKYFKFTGLHKNQIRYVLLGWGLFLISAAILSLILPFLLKNASVTKFGPLMSIFMVIFVVYAIVKHELMDIRIVIQRGLVYIFLFGLVVGAYVGLLQSLGYFLHKTTNITAVLSAAITTVIGVFLIRPLEDYFIKVTDPFFFKNKYNYPEALHQLSKILHTNLNQKDIVDHSSEMLRSIFKNEWVQFHLTDKSMSIAGADTALSADIIFKEEKIGVLELGPKKSGDAYTSYDKKLLDTFAYQAAVALEKARLYEKVQNYNADLEKLVNERTLEIKKLQEDQKQAMMDISHNLQTPLAVIKGELELLASSPAHMEKMQNVKMSITRISQFIRQLLHLAKLDQSAFNVELAPVNLSLLIEEQAEYFEVMAAEKDVELISSIAGKIFILGDKKFLSELLTNLVTNSIKYRRKEKEKGEKSFIKISLSEERKKACLVVTDNGIGISEEDLQEIFTRFYRGSSQSHTVGTGLGLAISKKIVEKHGGSISVESVLGEKTIFTIKFPIYKK